METGLYGDQGNLARPETTQCWQPGRFYFSTAGSTLYLYPLSICSDSFKQKQPIPKRPKIDDVNDTLSGTAVKVLPLMFYLRTDTRPRLGYGGRTLKCDQSSGEKKIFGRCFQTRMNGFGLMENQVVDFMFRQSVLIIQFCFFCSPSPHTSWKIFKPEKYLIFQSWRRDCISIGMTIQNKLMNSVLCGSDRLSFLLLLRVTIHKL